MIPKIVMKLNEICDYDRRLNCKCCKIYFRCRGDLKLLPESLNKKFCPYFQDINK